jgi:ligand-binding sensor domain-containing protein
MFAVRDIATTGDHLWVGTNGGLLRYSFSGDEPLRIAGDVGPGGEEIVGLHVDHRGHLWALSGVGLARYDAGAWDSRAGDLPALGMPTSLTSDASGRLWVGGSKGVAAFQNGRWKRWLAQPGITALTFHQEDLWVGTGGRGFYRIETAGTSHWYGPAQQSPCLHVRTLVSQTDRLWALCQNRSGTILVEFDGRTWTSWTAAVTGSVIDATTTDQGLTLVTTEGLWQLERVTTDQASSSDVQPLVQLSPPQRLEARQQKLRPRPVPRRGGWRRSAGARPPHAPFADTTLASTHPPSQRWLLRRLPQRPPPHPTVLHFDQRGLWLGTEGLGVLHFGDSEEPTPYRTLDLVIRERAFTVATDLEGRAWFLSRDLSPGMLGADSEEGFRLIDIEPDVTAGVQILAFCSRDHASYALGRIRDLPVLRVYVNTEGAWRELMARDVDVLDANADVSFFEVDPQGRFWLGLVRREPDRAEPVPAGVLVLDHRRPTVTLHGTRPRGPDARRLANIVTSVGFTATGDAWLGGLLGVTVLRKNGQRQRFSEANGLLGEIVADLAVDNDGAPWVATPAGIGTYREGRWHFFNNEQLRGIHVQTLAMDSRGELWAGGNRGLVHYDGQRWEVLTTEEGLLSQRIRSVHVDGHDRVWLVTEAGITLLLREPPE